MNVREQIRSILLHSWDPIGIAEFSEAANEYDGYIEQCVDTISKSNSSRDVQELLLYIEKEVIGVEGVPDLTEKAAKLLFELRGELVDGY